MSLNGICTLFAHVKYKLGSSECIWVMWTKDQTKSVELSAVPSLSVELSAVPSVPQTLAVPRKHVTTTVFC